MTARSRCGFWMQEWSAQWDSMPKCQMATESIDYATQLLSIDLISFQLPG